jgi:hypothetical protein
LIVLEVDGTDGVALPPGVRAVLVRQQIELAPIARAVSDAAGFPPRLTAADWRGEAAAASERLEERMRSQLRAADDALQAAVRSTRMALAELGG